MREVQETGVKGDRQSSPTAHRRIRSRRWRRRRGRRFRRRPTSSSITPRSGRTSRSPGKTDRRGLGAGQRRRPRRRALPDPRADRAKWSRRTNTAASCSSSATGRIPAAAAGSAHLSAAKMGAGRLGAGGLASNSPPHNIRVNVVSPGSIDTTRAQPRMVWAAARPILPGIPLGRQGKIRRDRRHLPVSWSATTAAASSPARRSTSTAGAAYY